MSRTKKAKLRLDKVKARERRERKDKRKWTFVKYDDEPFTKILPSESGYYDVMVNCYGHLKEIIAYYYAETMSWSINREVIAWKDGKKSITFFGCYHEQYKGKRIAEIDIDKCPKDGEQDADG